MDTPAVRHSEPSDTPTPTAGTPDPVSAVSRKPKDENGGILPHGCTCGVRWSGYSTAHCGAADCHRTFTGITAFDQHRRHGECVTPTDAGLVLRQRTGYTAWGLPGEFPTELRRTGEDT